MKDKSEIKTNPRPMFYACVLEKLREIALDCGYALAIHGTCASDLDLIAVRWRDNYQSPEYLVKQFILEMSHYVFAEEAILNFTDITCPELRFKNHYHFSIPIYSDWYIDLCVID
jgi:hypothetical protein